MPGKMPRPSGDWQMPAHDPQVGPQPGDVLAVEADRARAETGRMPEMARMVVVLPAPFAPIRATISPSSTCRLMPCSAWMRP